MEYLYLFFSGIVGAVFWVFNTEAYVMFVSFDKKMNPFIAASIAAIGQSITWTLLYFFGRVLQQKWNWLRLRIEKTKERILRHGDKVLAFTFSGAVFGIPPLIGCACLAPVFDLRYGRFIAVTILGRFIRFLFLAVAGRQLISIWNKL